MLRNAEAPAERCVMLERLKCAASDGIQGIIWEWIRNAEAVEVVGFSLVKNILTS